MNDRVAAVDAFGIAGEFVAMSTRCSIATVFCPSYAYPGKSTDRCCRVTLKCAMSPKQS